MNNNLKNQKGDRIMTTETQTQVTLNGVNTDSFKQILESMEADPTLAKCHFRTKNRWIDGAHNRATVQGFYGAGQEHDHPDSFVYEIDEPPVLLGDDIGPNPVEYVLMALSGCLTTTLIYYGAMMGIKLESVESSLEGDLNLQGLLNLNEDTRNGYENVRVTFKIESPAPREQIEELVKAAQRFSPVFDIVTHPVPVTVTLAS